MKLNGTWSFANVEVMRVERQRVNCQSVSTHCLLPLSRVHSLVVSVFLACSSLFISSMDRVIKYLVSDD